MGRWRGWSLGLLLALPGVAAEAACSRALRTHFEAVQLPKGVSARPDRLSRDWRWLLAISRLAGCPLALADSKVSAARKHDMLRKGEQDLMISASYLPQRERYAYFSQPYRLEQIRLYVRRSDAAKLRSVRSLQDLLDRPELVLLAPAAGWFGPDYARLKPQFHQAGRLLISRNSSQALQQLEAGRGDVLMTTDVLLDWLNELPSKNVVALPAVIHEAPVHIMLSKASLTPADVGVLNNAILKLTGGKPGAEPPPLLP